MKTDACRRPTEIFRTFPICLYIWGSKGSVYANITILVGYTVWRSSLPIWRNAVPVDVLDNFRTSLTKKESTVVFRDCKNLQTIVGESVRTFHFDF